jgi:hypothetical protein
MPHKWKCSLTVIAAIALLALAVPAGAGVPDITQSYYVPQVGTVASPTEGTLATRFFRMCPNNDGGASLSQNSRIKVVVRDANGVGIPGIAAADICILFNGGTPIQGFSGVGADSVEANSQYNQSPLCPDLRCVAADAPTDANGATYITFAGADVNNPGVTLRNANRKWGHYDTELPVYVLGFKIPGFLTSARLTPYQLRIKSFDHSGGTGTLPLNSGESVTITDYNAVFNGITGAPNQFTYWRDFDYNGTITITDVNIVFAHLTHDCDSPQP